MIVTDLEGKVADKTVTMSDTEWTLLGEFLDGSWPIEQVPNPNYDPNGSEDEAVNPPTINIDMRWNVIDQTEAAFFRYVRSQLNKNAEAAAQQQVEAAAEAAKGRLQKDEKGDTQSRTGKKK